MGTDAKLPKKFDKPVTTDQRDYRVSHFLFAEKFFPARLQQGTMPDL